MYDRPDRGCDFALDVDNSAYMIDLSEQSIEIDADGKSYFRTSHENQTLIRINNYSPHYQIKSKLTHFTKIFIELLGFNYSYHRHCYRLCATISVECEIKIIAR